MREVPKILDDTRPIRSLVFSDNTQYMVGEMGITEIVPYGECAEFCVVPWFAIMKGDVLTNRVPAYQVLVTYEVQP